jgi:SNF2 family DNA or RNA helicase
VVLTTYNIVRLQRDIKIRTQDSAAAWIKRKLLFGYPRREFFPLFVIYWWFVILDEALRVANLSTSISVAVRALQGLYRLLMTGTPLQNDYADIQRLLGFMRIRPWYSIGLFKQVSSLCVYSLLSPYSQLVVSASFRDSQKNVWIHTQCELDS